jgi:short-subunit dehydrogenase
VVVNNAGYGLNGSFAEIPYHHHIDNINVNIKAVVDISHRFIPVLNKRAKGYLLNIASTTSYQTVPYLNIYASTKSFVLFFTRGLSYELRHTNVSVSALSPESTDTDFVKCAKMGESVLKAAKKFNMSPEAVGKIAV